MVHLFGDQPDGSWTWTDGFDPGHNYGVRFQITTACTLTHIGYYRGGTGAGPPTLQFWGPTGAALLNVTPPTDSGAAGWQWSSVGAGIPLTPGNTYTVSATYAGEIFFGTNSSPASRVAAPAPFIHDDTPLFVENDPYARPASAVTTSYRAISAQVTVPVPPPPGEGEGDPTLTGDLQSWLSALASVNTHQTDGLPWLTKEQLDALAAAVDLIPKALGTDWTKVHEIWQFAGDLTDVQLGLWRAFMDRAGSQLTGPTAGGGSAFHGPGGIQVSAAAEEILLAVDKLWHRTQTTNWLIPVPGSEWLKADELTYTGPIGWNQEADVYVNRFTTWPDTADRQDIGDNIWLPRAMWWAPLTGTLPHERRFCDMDVQILHNLPLRSSGILLNPKNGFEGVIEAWIRPDV